jgi:hypothetical protein
MTLWKLWPYALGAFALFLGWQAYSAMLRRDGALHEQVRALETRNAQLEDHGGGSTPCTTPTRCGWPPSAAGMTAL